MTLPLATLMKQTGEKEIQSGIPDQKLQEAKISPGYATSVVVWAIAGSCQSANMNANWRSNC
jgi:hypothetical protein